MNDPTVVFLRFLILVQVAFMAAGGAALMSHAIRTGGPYIVLAIVGIGAFSAYTLPPLWRDWKKYR